MIRISVIIPTYNGADKIGRTLRHLLSMDLPGIHEILVVNDGSEDNTSEVLEEFLEQVEIHSIDHGGRSVARNFGAQEASGEVLWFIDDDISIQSDSLMYQSGHFTEYPSSILVGRILEDEELCVSDFHRYKRALSERWQNDWGPVRTEITENYISAANFMISRELFLDLGGFDEELSDLEDNDLAIRARKNSVPIYYDPALLGLHNPPANAASYLRRLKEYEGMREGLSGKHGISGKTALLGSLRKWIFGGTGKVGWIDSGTLNWLPRKLRYKLYDLILDANIR